MKNLTDFHMTEEAKNSFIANYIAERKEKQLILSNFINTVIFYKIIRAIIDNNIFLDEENFRYFPEKTLSLFKIPELKEEQLITFISCITNNELILPQNISQEEDNFFENTTCEKLGLKVFMMWGQGCCIQIFSAAINRRG